MSEILSDLQSFLRTCTAEERQELQRMLGEVAAPHPLERKWNISAAEVLDAISSGSDLIQRGVRGVIADRAFYRYVVPLLEDNGWNAEVITGDRPYDVLLQRGTFSITVQVKMQRKAAGEPKTAKSRFFTRGANFWVVETQKTRAGTDSEGGSTRPYRFGEFDILAVNLHSSSQDWSSFIYTVANWLIPDPAMPENIYKYQPVPKCSDGEWTNDFEECVHWLMDGRIHEIGTAAR